MNASSDGSSNNNNVGSGCSSASAVSNSTEEPRVPPLHISLRGPNAAVVVSNRKDKKSPSSSSHWPQLDEPDRFALDSNETNSDFYTKLNKKKLKLSNLKLGRESVAINSSELNQKTKKLKLKRVMADDSGLKLKIPVVSPPVPDGVDSADDKLLLKKRKDSKKQKNNLLNLNKRHLTDLTESDPAKRYDDILSSGSKRVELNLKMDSEEWISRTLKEETLNYEKRKNCNKLMDDLEVEEKVEHVESAVSESDNLNSLEPRRVPEENDKAPEGDDEEEKEEEEDRTKTFKTGTFELSDLLRRKKVGDNNKKLKGLESLKIKTDFTKNKFMELSELAEGNQEEEEEEKTEEVTVKKPQEIGGKIKSELSSKIDRVSGKLKNDLSLKFSKDGVNKKLKFEESGLKKLKLDDLGKGLKKNEKPGSRNKMAKKEGIGVRIGTLGAPSTSDGEVDRVTVEQDNLSRTKRRHSGDQNVLGNKIFSHNYIIKYQIIFLIIQCWKMPNLGN